MSRPYRIYSREFKLSVVRRMEAGESLRGLMRTLKIAQTNLHLWRRQVRQGGAEALRDRGGRRAGEALAGGGAGGAEPSAAERIAGLERKIGQQELDLDFFRQALQQVGEARRRSGGPGATGSTGSSKG